MVQIHVRAPVSKPPCLSSNRASFVNSYSSVRVRPGAPAAVSRPRLGRPSGLWCNSSISAREADGPGANPGFLTNFDGPLVVDYRTKNETERGCSSTATELPGESAGDAGSSPAIRFLSHSTFCPSSLSDGPLIMGYLVKSRTAGRAGSNPAQSGDRLFPISLLVRRGFFDGSQDWVIAS